MPTLPFTEIPAGFAQVTYTLAAPGQSGEINLVLGHENVDDLEIDVFAGGVQLIFQTLFVEQMLAAPVTYLGLRVEFGVRPGGQVYEVVADPDDPIAGDQGANMLPVNNALLIKKNTGFGGKANRGRMYVPGVSETIIANDGTMDSTSLAQYQSAADAFFTAHETNTPIVLLHLQHQTSGPGVLPKTYAANAPAPTTVTSLQVSNKMATQRTRLRD